MYRYLEKIIKNLIYHDKAIMKSIETMLCLALPMHLFCAQSHDWSLYYFVYILEKFPSIFFYIAGQGCLDKERHSSRERSPEPAHTQVICGEG